MEKIITGTWLALSIWGFGVVLYNVYDPFKADSKIWKSAGLSFFLAIMITLISVSVAVFKTIGG